MTPATTPEAGPEPGLPEVHRAYQMIENSDSEQESQPQEEEPPDPEQIPAKIPAIDKAASTAGSHGAFATPVRTMSAVEAR